MAVDITGRKIEVGHTVVRAYVSGRSARLETAVVTKLDPTGRPYLDGRKVPLQCAHTTVRILS